MSKKVKIFIVVSIVTIVLTVGSVLVLVPYLYSAQYNSNGVSHFLVITIDKSQPKELIGVLENHNVYIEGLDIQETNFRTKDAENLSIINAIEKNLVSIEEWENYAWGITKKGNGKILRFENYEIYVDSENCIIRPITKE